jgi:hypothetical protein
MSATLAPVPSLLRDGGLTGRPTEAVEDGGLRYFVNEFWTAGQRQAHRLHEISYRACFKPQLPAFFIARLTAPGGTVYDPFSGRGTTALQAALMGRRPVANDVNPLGAMLLAPRLAPPSLAEIAARLASLDLAQRRAEPPPSELLAFFHPETLNRIAALRAHLLAPARLDAADSWLRMVALNRLTGHSPGFFSVYTLPPNQAISAAAQVRINAARGQTPPPRDVAKLILAKSASLLADGGPPPHPAPLLMTRPAHDTPALSAGSVDLIVTSPPFLDVVDYRGDNWLRCWFAGIDPAGVALARHRDVAAWERFVRGAFAEFARVLRPGGMVAFEVGEVRRGRVLLERHVVAALVGLPFRVHGVMLNRQRFTKTAQCWGVANNTGGTNSNRIVLAERVA